MTARQALELATRGGAAVLGRKDLGSLGAGQMRRLLRRAPEPPDSRRRLARSGSCAGLLLAGTRRITVVGGKVRRQRRQAGHPGSPQADRAA